MLYLLAMRQPIHRLSGLNAKAIALVFVGVLSACTGHFSGLDDRASFTGDTCDLLSAPVRMRAITDLQNREIMGSAQWLTDNDTLIFADNGQAWSYRLSDSAESCLSCAFDAPAEVHRVNVLPYGSYILLGPADPLEDAISVIHDAPTRLAGDAIWWLAADLQTPPQNLGYRAFEMVATSRSGMQLAWASGIGQGDLVDPQTLVPSPPDTLGATAHTARLEIAEGQARLIDVQEVYHWPQSIVQISNFLPDDAGLALTTFWSLERRFYPSPEEFQNGHYTANDAEAWTLDLSSGELTNQSQFGSFDELEGLSPDGRYAFLESNRDNNTMEVNILELGSDGAGLRALTQGGRLDIDGATDPTAFDASFSPNGRRGVIGLGLSSSPQRAVPNHTSLALIEFDCGE